jgi:hypothetical protein
LISPNIFARVNVPPLTSQPYYALTTGLVEEPQIRIANKRIFAQEDVDRIAKHFGIALGRTGRKERHE